MRLRLPLVVIGIAALIAALWVTRRSTNPKEPLQRPPVAARAVTSVAFQTPPPTVTPALPVEYHSSLVVPWEAEPAATPSPTATPIEEEPTIRPGPSPTPDVSECVTAQYSASMLAAAPGQVLVDIRAANRCGRDLAPLEVWFWVAGYRQGDLVQSVRGHPFDPIPRDGEADVHIALPGSIDWYDQIEVRVLQPDTR